MNNGVFQCDRNPKRCHAACKAAQRKQACSEFEKKNIRNFIYSKEQISILARKFPSRLLDSVPGRLYFRELFVASIGYILFVTAVVD